MSGDEGLGDGQTHAGTADLIALVPAPIELVENEALLEGVNAGAMIGNAERNEIASELGGDSDGMVFGGVKMGVIDELDEDVLGAVQIGHDKGQVTVNVKIDRAVAKGFFHMLQSSLDESVNREWFKLKLDRAGFEPGHFRGFLDEVIEAVALRVNDGEKFLLLGSFGGGRGKKIGGCGFNGG